MTIEVRRVAAGEGLPLRELRLAALAEAPSAFSATLAEAREQAFAFWANRAESSATGELAATFVADGPDGWSGMVAGYREARSDHVVQLVSMWVAPEARGQGIGLRLVQQVLAWAHEIGCAEVELWVTRGNEAAIGLYRAAGFDTVEGHRPLASDPCRDEIRMRYVLAR